MRKIAISDIHACLKTFRYLLEEKVKLQPEDQLYLLGDYIDRGPDSKGVIDYILQLKEEGFQLHCLMGNHEELLLESMHDSGMREIWDRNGGMTTKRSFGVKAAHKIPEKYLDFFRQLKLYQQSDDYLFVHAGLDFTQADPLSDREGMLWSRNWEKDISYDWLGSRKIIYGHTPRAKEKVIEKFEALGTEQFFCIDAGCVFDHLPGYGHLCAFDLTNSELHFAANRE